jgi:hypothetical protein
LHSQIKKAVKQKKLFIEVYTGITDKWNKRTRYIF